MPRKAAVTAGDELALSFNVAGTLDRSATWTVLQPGGGRVSPTGHYSAPDEPGTFHVMVRSLVAGGGEDQVEVQVHPRPRAEALRVEPARVVKGGIVTLTPVFKGGKGTLQPGGLEVTSGTAVQLSVDSPTEFTLRVVNGLGVSDEAKSRVELQAPAAQVRGIDAPARVQAGSHSMARVIAHPGARLEWSSEDVLFLGAEAKPTEAETAFTPLRADGTYVLKVRAVGGVDPAGTPSGGLTEVFTFQGAVEPLPAGSAPDLRIEQAFLSLGRTGIRAWVEGPAPGAAYTWSIRNGLFKGGHASATGDQVEFDTAHQGLVTLTCRCDHPGGGGAATTRCATVVSHPAPPLIQTVGRPVAGVQQWAFVKDPKPGVTYRWEMDAAEGILSAPERTDGPAAATRFTALKPGPLVLKCRAVNTAGEVSEAHALTLTAEAPGPLAEPRVTWPTLLRQNTAGNTLAIQDPLPELIYTWACAGAVKEDQTDASFTFRVDRAPLVALTLTARNPETGAAASTTRVFEPVEAPSTPVILSAPSVLTGSPQVAGLQHGGRRGETYRWTLTHGVLTPPAPGTQGRSVAFQSAVPGPYTLTCVAINEAGDESAPAVFSGVVVAPSAPAPGPGGTPPPIGASSIPGPPPIGAPSIPGPPPIGAPSIPGPPPIGAPSIPMPPPIGAPSIPTPPPPSFIQTFTASKLLLAPEEAVDLAWTLPANPSGNQNLKRDVLIPASTAGANRLRPAAKSLPPAARVETIPDVQRRETFTLEANGSTATVAPGVHGLSLVAGQGASIANAYLDGSAQDPLLFPGSAAAPAFALRYATGLAYAGGQWFVAEGEDHTIRRIDASGTLANFVGGRGRPDEGRHYTDARLNNPGALAVLGADLVIADRGSHTVKAVPLTGRDALGQHQVRVLAGVAGQAGDTDGALGTALLKDVTALATHAGQNLVALIDNKKFKLVHGGQTRTLPVAAPAVAAFNTAHPSAKLPVPTDWDPRSLVMAPTGEAYLAVANCIMKLTPSNPGNLAASSWTLTLLAGKKKAGHVDGPLSSAEFAVPVGLALDGTTLYVAERSTHDLRAIDLALGRVTTLSGTGGVTAADLGWADYDGTAGRTARYNRPSVLAVGGHALLVADQSETALRRVMATGPDAGKVLTWGRRQGPNHSNGSSTTARDDHATGAAKFAKLEGISVDEQGNAYVADSKGFVLMKVGVKGEVSVEAGTLNTPKDVVPRAPRDQLGFRAPSRPVYLGQGVTLIMENGRTLFQLKGGVAEAMTAALPSKKFYQYKVFPTGDAARTHFLLSGEYVTGHPGVWMTVANRKECVKNVRALAVAADKANAVYILSRTTPLGGDLVLTKYRQPTATGSAEWDEVSHIAICPGDQLEARNCGMPDIKDMVVDTKGNVYLADSANGMIWRVEADFSALERVAGKYPYIGFLQPGNATPDTPLGPLGGLALTRHDDLMFLLGESVCQFTGPGTASTPWAPPVQMASPVLAIKNAVASSPAAGGGGGATPAPTVVDADPPEDMIAQLKRRQMNSKLLTEFGLQVVAVQDAERPGLHLPPGGKLLKVTRVNAGSLAGTAGLQVGSVIFTVNGGQVTGLTDFAKLVTVTDPSILRMSVALNPATPPLTRTNVTLTRP